MEEDSGSCPVCLDTFKIGDEVTFLKTFQDFCNSLQVLLPGCHPAHGCHPACLLPWLTRWQRTSPDFWQYFSPLFASLSVFTFSSFILILILIKPLLRHSTCPVCRKVLGAQEEDEVGSDEEDSDAGSTSDEEVLHSNVI